MEILHRDLYYTQHEHVWRGEPTKSIYKKSDEFQRAGGEASRALRESLQVSLGVGSKIQKAHEQAAHEEKCVDAESPVCDGLEEESLLHHFAILHVVRIFKNDNARVPEDDPGHRDRSEPVHGANCVAAHVTVADNLHISGNGERK